MAPGLNRPSSQSSLRTAGASVLGGTTTNPSRTLHSSSSSAGLLNKEAVIARFEAQARQVGRSFDGMLDLQQFSMLVRRGDASISERDCRSIFQHLDKECRGKIAFQKFVDWSYAPKSEAALHSGSTGSPHTGNSKTNSNNNTTFDNPTGPVSPPFTRQSSHISLPPSCVAATRRRKSSLSEASGVKQPERFVMAADCGGTTSRLMLYSVSPDEVIEPGKVAPGRLTKEIKYPNIMFKSLKDIVEVFVTQDSGMPRNARITVAVFALAGIVIDGQCRFTNLDWVVNAKEIERDLQIGRVELINDFVAQGYGMLTLADDEVVNLNGGVPRYGAPKSCIGAGTGLGQCYLVPDAEGDYKCYPSEGAHGEFGPRGAGSDDTQLELLKYLKVKLSGWNRISVERVVSGTGICNIYEFLAHKWPEHIDKEVHRRHLLSPKDAGIIVTSATPGSLSEKALQIFSSCYGAQTGTMALFLQPYGGLYVTGGVTKKIADWMLKDGSFMEAYMDKGRLTPICEQVPLLLVKGDDMGQRGAHRRAVTLLQQLCREQARSLFNALDENSDGKITLAEVQDVARQHADWEIAQKICDQYGDSNRVFEFEEFYSRFAGLLAEANITAEMLGGQVDEAQVNLQKDRLVAPPDRGNSQASRMELAKLLGKYDELRSQYQAQPVFKAPLWELRKGTDLSDPTAWEESEYYINQQGAVIWYNKVEKKTQLFCSQHDLRFAKVEAISDPTSCKPWAFQVVIESLSLKHIFAGTSEAGRAFWMEHLVGLSGDS